MLRDATSARRPKYIDMYLLHATLLPACCADGHAMLSHHSSRIMACSEERFREEESCVRSGVWGHGPLPVVHSLVRVLVFHVSCRVKRSLESIEGWLCSTRTTRSPRKERARNGSDLFCVPPCCKTAFITRVPLKFFPAAQVAGLRR